MLLVECLRNIRTTFACGHSGSAKPFSSLQTVTEGSTNARKRWRLAGAPAARASVYTSHSREIEAKEATGSKSKWERKGNVRVEICSCVGWLWALAAWGCGIVSSPPHTHQVSLSYRKDTHVPALFLSSSLAVILACMLRLCSNWCRRVSVRSETSSSSAGFDLQPPQFFELV